MGTVVLSGVQSGRGVKLTAYLHLEGRLRKSGAVQLFPHVPLRSDKAQIYLSYSYFFGFIYIYVGTTARLSHMTAQRPLQMYFIKQLTD